METKGFYQVRGRVQEFLKKLAVALILIGIGVVTTLGTGAYVWLKTDIVKLEDQKMELIQEKASLIRELEDTQVEQLKLIGQ